MSDTSTHITVKDGKIHVRRYQDSEEIVDNNKRLQNAGKQPGDMRLIGSIPAIILERWIQEDATNYLALPKDEFSRLIRRKLRDPDWKWLRTTPGSI